MKKGLIFTAAVVAALTFASCGGKNNSAAPASDSTEVADTLAAAAEAATKALTPETQQAASALTEQVSHAIESKDAKAVTTALADVAATYKALVNAGKLDEAKNYATVVKNFVNQNADALKSLTSGDATSAATTITNLVNTVENLPTTAATTADEAKQAVAQDVVNLASPYLQKGAAAASTAETAAKNAASAAAQAGQQAVDNEVNKAKSKVNEKATEAQTKAANEVNKAQKKANDAVNNAANKALKGLGL